MTNIADETKKPSLGGSGLNDGLERLPCPFCGSNDINDGEVLTTYPNGKMTTQSECNDCKALGAEALLDAAEVDYGCIKAISAWNKRSNV